MSRRTSRPCNRRRLLAASLPIGIGLLLAPCAAAFGAWSATGTGATGGAATVMPTGATPSVSAAGTSVSVRWSLATLPGGAAVAGYVVKRYDATNGSLATVQANCSGTVTVTTCTESGVPAGSWNYTVTPVQSSWTGGESSYSAVVTTT